MRARNQSGWIEETDARNWKAHWYEYVRDPQTGAERRQHKSRIVGKKSHMRKFEAKEALGKILAPVNATQTSRRDDRVPLRWFVENRWQPTREGKWGATTKKTNGYFVQAILASSETSPCAIWMAWNFRTGSTTWPLSIRVRWSSTVIRI